MASRPDGFEAWPIIVPADGAPRRRPPPTSTVRRFVARNIEIKAKIDSLSALAQRVARLATEGPVEIAQDDTFFRCEAGRLKLRTFSATEGELIFYRRTVDDVQGLGQFMELEVVLDDGEADESGVREAQALMMQLGIEPSQLLQGAYVDLLARSGA